MGYLRDIRRLTVALSRARFGLYILGRREVFDGCHELRQAFEMLLERTDKLTLVTGELWPSQRKLLEDANEKVEGEAVMEGVEHLGQYVYEMTNTKLAQLRAENPEAPVVLDDVAEIKPIPEEVEGEEELQPAEGVEAEN